MSVNLFAIVVLPLGFLAIYIPLIKREEEYLKEIFGAEYIKYMKKTPRFFPKFKLYHAPAEVTMTPRTLLSATKDSIMWFLAFPLLEVIGWLQSEGYFKPLIHWHF